jgi:phosphoribosylamine--glycine ligase
MDVLVIGGGGREHCLVWKISKSRLVNKVYAIPGNAGIAEIAKCADISVSKDNFQSLLNFVEEKKVDLVVVGPEAPLVDGIVDFFNKNGIKIFGPSKKASMIEGSKVFTKKLCWKYGIPTADGNIFKKEEYEKALNFIEGIASDKFPVVIKADGLAAGKGVIIADDREAAIEALKDCFVRNIFGQAGETVIIEDFMSGHEVSILNLCDGKDIVPMVLAQDYKRIFDNDKGKNTGGMGSYSPVPTVSREMYKKILNTIIYPTYKSLIKENIEYKGILYGGIIISDNQPYLLEYNCRFGDPETQAILPRLNDDIVPLLLNCINGKLSKSKLDWDNKKCVCIVAASKGYPESSSCGDAIEGLDSCHESDSDLYVFHAGTKVLNNKIATNGGRVLGVVSKADNFKAARQKVFSELKKIKFNGMQYRKDIALKAEEFG